uniref:Putative small heat shock protein n=2 Tax=Graphocephala atropunctata TaxID=36148 RepID=Q1W289_9HEMI|nr:putative small heat shock protein [Graphocephala atropunctata]
MSMVPYIVREMLRDMDRPTLYDQHFGLGLSPANLVDHGLLTTPMLSGYLRPWRILNQADSGLSNIVNDKDNFKVSLDVQQFKPEELTVKVVDNCVVVEGKHEERSDEHGFVSRQFTRRYRLPDNCDVQALQSSLSSDGVLQLTAPKKSIEDKGARPIPITQTNTPAVKAADGKPQDEKTKAA